MAPPADNDEPPKRPVMRTRRNTATYTYQGIKPNPPVSKKRTREANQNNDQLSIPAATKKPTREANRNNDQLSVPPVTKKSRREPKRNNDQLSITNFFIVEHESSFDVEIVEEISNIEDCIFGWTTMGRYDIPFIVKQSEKYCAIRMIEHELAKPPQVIPKIGFCKANLKFLKPTKVQCQLLDEINRIHCDFRYGRPPFTAKDILVRHDDANKYLQFVNVCENLLKMDAMGSQEELDFGFILVNKKSYVPYTKLGKVKFIPLIYFHCDNLETSDILKSQSENLSGDDALFLKFCCKFDGIWNEELEKEIGVIGLDIIQEFAPPKTTFEDCWPTKNEKYRLHVVRTVKGFRLENIKRTEN